MKLTINADFNTCLQIAQIVAERAQFSYDNFYNLLPKDKRFGILEAVKSTLKQFATEAADGDNLSEQLTELAKLAQTIEQTQENIKNE